MKPVLQARRGGWTLTDLLVVIIVVFSGFGLLFFGILLPSLASAKQRAGGVTCANNLSQIGKAFRLWSGDNADRYPMRVSVTNGGTLEFVPMGLVFPHFQVLSNELNTPKVLRCPRDTERTNAWNFTSDFNDWKLSYFVGVDADETEPNVLLAGDRNITVGGRSGRRGLVTLLTNSPVGWTTIMHSNQGNITLGDGSVQQLSVSGFQKLLQASGVTNRLAIP
jgi:prepilin-type processing-associated H-X9-DG protein